MTVPEIWPGQDRGGKKKKKNELGNPIKHPLRGSLTNDLRWRKYSAFSSVDQAVHSMQGKSKEQATSLHEIHSVCFSYFMLLILRLHLLQEQ